MHHINIRLIKSSSDLLFKNFSKSLSIFTVLLVDYSRIGNGESPYESPNSPISVEKVSFVKKSSTSNGF